MTDKSDSLAVHVQPIKNKAGDASVDTARNLFAENGYDI